MSDRVEITNNIMYCGGHSLNNYKIGNCTYKAKGTSRILKYCRQISSSEHSVTQAYQQKQMVIQKEQKE